MAFGSTVLTLVTNPVSAPTLARLAAMLAAPDSGSVVPLTVVSQRDAAGRDAERVHAAAEALIIRTEEIAQRSGVASRGLVAVEDAVADAVLDAADEREATLVVMGWQGHSTQQNVFGAIIDSIVGRSAIPLAITRLQPHPWRRVLLPIDDDHLGSGGTWGVRLAAAVAGRLALGAGARVRVLRTGPARRPLPRPVQALADRLHHDPRRLDIAVGAAAAPEDLIVVPVAPTESGLRSSATHIAWAAPDASLLVAIDAGPVRVERLAGAVEQAGLQPPPSEPEVIVSGHAITVTARRADGAAAALRPHVTSALEPLGPVSDAPDADDDRDALRLRVVVDTGDGNIAMTRVMTALHEAPGMEGAEIRYDLAPAPREASESR